jgi:transketolase N-terminal domain/subunit
MVVMIRFKLSNIFRNSDKSKLHMICSQMFLLVKGHVKKAIYRVLAAFLRLN